MLWEVNFDVSILARCNSDLSIVTRRKIVWKLTISCSVLVTCTNSLLCIAEKTTASYASLCCGR